MNWMNFIGMLLIAVTVSGCAGGMKLTYDSEGRITQIKVNRSGEYSIKNGETEAKANTKFEPLKDVFNFQGIKTSD